MSAVTLDAVSKRFGDTVAVDSVSLEVADRDFLVLLGPSGCGKTTVLRLVAGFERATAGTISIGGVVVNDLPPKKRDVAMVFQSYALYPHKTVFQNVEFPLKTRKVVKAERAEQVEATAAMLQLSNLLTRKPGQMSGGQRQRVAVARAIVRHPKVFLMDEPLSNLDAKLRQETRGELLRLHERLSATILYVTHDQVEAMTMANRVAVMHQGRLQQVGPPQEVYDRPANVFVAQFLGTPPMNIFPPGVVETGDHLVGVRPEHLVLDPAGPVVARVVLVEELGHERHLTCQLGEGERIVVRAASGEPGPGMGEEIRLHAPERHRQRFDADTGLRRPS
jgi:multiple sugar transport system ATP-binding protein